MATKNPVVVPSDVLDRVAGFIRRFVSLSEAQGTVITLWVAHTHAFDAADSTPYLSISSAEKQCGKTRLLEVLNLLVEKPWFTGSVSKAVLVRKLDAHEPTLLLDESDAAFAGDKEYSEALRAVLNCGHTREGVASLCVTHGPTIDFKDFRVFCPKAIAGIGRLPDTIADRAIPLRMKRRAPSEQIERFRSRLLKTETDELRGQLMEWITPAIPRLRDAKPTLPESLSDRQQDGCEPLLAIADAAEGHWPQSARKALLDILTGEAGEDDSVGVRLLGDIHTVFGQQNAERLGSLDLLTMLCNLEPQWLEFSHGKPLSAAGISRLLKRYGIHHRKLRFESATLWGYERESFRDAWVRYLRQNVEQVEQHRSGTEETQLTILERGPSVPAQEIAESSANTRLVPSVPVRGNEDEKKRRCYIHGARARWWERPPVGSGDWVCGDCHPEVNAPTAREIGFD